MYKTILGLLLGCASISIACADNSKSAGAGNESRAAKHGKAAVSSGVKSAADKNTVVPGAGVELEAKIRDYLLQHPEVLVEALNRYQAQQYKAMQERFSQTQAESARHAGELFHSNVDPVMGNPNGKVSLVEFSDYQCGHCKEIAPVLESLIKDNNELKVIIKELPVRGALSEEAALAALASKKQNKYAEFRAALLNNADSLDSAKIYTVAESVGLNVEQLKKDMADPAIVAELSANKTLGVSLKIMGTPSLFVANSAVVDGAPEAAIQYIPGFMAKDKLQELLNNFKQNITK